MTDETGFMNKKILIYDDEGCSDISFIKRKLSAHFKKLGVGVDTIDAEEIKNNKLDENVIALVMPGGYAKQYEQKLGDEGNNKIKEYVKAGGVYFGICAGGYYSAKNIVFEKGIKDKEVIDKGLGLIDGTAIGTLSREFNIDSFSRTPDSVTVVKLGWEKSRKESYAYYHGGPYFEMKEDDEHKVVAYYKDLKEKKPAIVKRIYGKGRVIATGIHAETQGDDMVIKVLRYGNWDNQTSDLIIKTLMDKDKAIKNTFKMLMREIYSSEKAM